MLLPFVVAYAWAKSNSYDNNNGDESEDEGDDSAVIRELASHFSTFPFVFVSNLDFAYFFLFTVQLCYSE